MLAAAWSYSSSLGPQLRGLEHRVLPEGDSGEDRLCVELSIGFGFGAKKLPDHTETVALIENREARAEAQCLGLLANEAHAEAVKRRQPNPSAVSRPIMSPRRSRISLAALLVKVTARIASAGTPLASSRAIRAVITRVFPEPAPAKTSNGPSSCSTAARCCALSRKDARGSPARGLVQGKSTRHADSPRRPETMVEITPCPKKSNGSFSSLEMAGGMRQSGHGFRQGFLSTEPERTVRVRVAGRAWLHYG